MGNKHIVLFACCLLVRGYSRSTLVDIQRWTFIFLPLEIEDLLRNSHLHPIDDLLSNYSDEDQIEIGKYFDYLIQNEYAFHTDTPESFPSLSLDWKSPHYITNAIIDLDHTSDFDIKHIILQLEELGCETVQLRCYDKFEFEFFRNILTIISGATGKIRSVEFTICFNNEISTKQYLKLMKLFPRLVKTTIHSAPNEYNHPFPDGNIELKYITQEINDESHCGFVSPEYFTVNKYFFTEAQQHNSCLNRKISIDKSGYIKNCPAMSTNFGHTSTTSLTEISKKDSFQKMWNINKDKINICKDCEFRYMCIDCRAFVQDEHNEFSKPLKCKYNPYDMTWV